MLALAIRSCDASSAMARRPRCIFPGIPHHVTQRGNYRQDVFHSDDDRRGYLAWLREYSERYGLRIWAYCLMTNHVHLIVCPEREDSVSRALAATHMRHAQALNSRRGSPGHLWQGRFFSCPLDDDHLLHAARYVERNPARAGMVRRASEWRWSSAGAHLGGPPDPVLSGASWPPADLLRDWAAILEEPDDPEADGALRHHTYTGRPRGGEFFIERLEALAGRPLRARPVGRPKKPPSEGPD